MAPITPANSKGVRKVDRIKVFFFYPCKVFAFGDEPGLIHKSREIWGLTTGWWYGVAITV